MRTLDIKCSECKGNGSKPGYKQVCKNCHGSTIVRKHIGVPFNNGTSCTECSDGFIITEPTICRYCKGVGYTPTEYGWKMLRHKELVKFIKRHT